MTYDEAWDKSTGWIAHYWRAFAPRGIEYDDYFQECALCFYGKLKQNYSPYACWEISKIAYKRVMIRLLFRSKERRKVYVPFNECDSLLCCYEESAEWRVELKPHLREVAECIINGYETAEICTLTGKTKETVYTYIRDIKRIYAAALGITGYQRKRLRKFTRNRTEKELQNWQIGKARLAQIAKSRVKSVCATTAKCLLPSEKSRQCAT